VNTYVPQTSTTTTTYHSEYIAPAGPAPLALPASHGYQRQPKQKRGFGQKLGDAFSKLQTKAQQSWNEATDDRFRRYFNFPFSEQLFGEFWGEVWTNTQLIACSFYISNNYICLLYKRKDPVSHDKVHVKAVIPLCDISCIQRAICLPPASGSVPVIQACNDPTVRPDSVQLYTLDGKMHQFTKIHNYENFYNTLDYLWKSARMNARQGGQPTQIAPQTNYAQQSLPQQTSYQQPAYQQATYQQPAYQQATYTQPTVLGGQQQTTTTYSATPIGTQQGVPMQKQAVTSTTTTTNPAMSQRPGF